MSITHYRSVPRHAFFDALGLRDWALQRLPGSSVRSADIILRDEQGAELGRFELRYDADGDAYPHLQLLPCAAPDELQKHATLWL